MNQLILGDNLQVMKEMPSESVDLIYLDPPFFSNRNYEVIWGDKGEVLSFEDRWSGGMAHYISWLKERVIEMHRILKSTGSIFLHCDSHANAHIRVFILDSIFGENNFKGEIVWKRSSAHNDAKQGRKGLGNISDTIWYYSKSSNFTFNQLHTPYNQEYIEHSYRHTDGAGRKYRLDNLTGPGGASKGNPSYEFLGVTRYWRYSQKRMNELYEAGRIIQVKPGSVPSYKRYLDEMPGVTLQNIWDDIKPLQSQSKERIGYPTQKLEALIERIIKLSSKEGDTVLDPFMGGGTTMAIADKLNRCWIGIDQSVQAVKITEMRLNKQQDLFSQPFISKLHKYDYDTLRYSDAFQFETFIVQQYGGVSNAKQRNDMGIDGRSRDGMPIQVKRSDNIGRNVIDNFFSAVQRYDKHIFEKNKELGQPVGCIIAFSFGKGAIQEVARLKLTENVIINLISVDSLVEIAHKPTLRVDFNNMGIDTRGCREIAFAAKAYSDASIGFYSWDYKQHNQVFRPEIVMDKTGVQTKKFVAGFHHIAIKVVDNQGLEGFEVLKLKVNGHVSLQA